MRIRRSLAAAGALVVIAGLATGCSGSSGSSGEKDGPCTWPEGDVAQYALALGHESGSSRSQHDRYLAFDVTTGQVVGDCAVHPGQLPQITTLTVDGASPRATFSGAATPPPTLPAADTQYAPDNRGDVTVVGAVRELRTGRTTTLGFTGWRVVATSGSQLVLVHAPDATAAYPTDPADWCVLPEPSASRSRCAAVPGSSAPGTGGIAPDGTVHWTPAAGRAVTVAGTSVVLARATDGAVPAAATAGVQVPTGLDQHSLVFPPGAPGPGSASLLRWATGRDLGSASLRTSTADVTAVNRVTGSGYTAVALDGGSRLVLVAFDGRVAVVTPGGPANSLVTLHLPPGVLSIDPLSWPASAEGA